VVKTWPDKQDHRDPVVRVSDPAMAWHQVNLNDLLACCRRELSFRQRVYPKWVDKGTMTEKKAEAEIELMRSICDFLVHCIFKAVTRGQRRPPGAPPTDEAHDKQAQ
jgi:hypothetical protein